MKAIDISYQGVKTELNIDVNTKQFGDSALFLAHPHSLRHKVQTWMNNNFVLPLSRNTDLLPSGFRKTNAWIVRKGAWNNFMKTVLALALGKSILFTAISDFLLEDSFAQGLRN